MSTNTPGAGSTKVAPEPLPAAAINAQERATVAWAAGGEPTAPAGDGAAAPARRRTSFRRFDTRVVETQVYNKGTQGDGKEPKVRISRVLRVAQEYRGFRSMFVALAAAYTYSLIIGLHYEFPGDALTQAAVMKQWTSTADGRSVWEVKSLEDSGRYSVDWLADQVEASIKNGETDTIYINDQFRVLAYHISIYYFSGDQRSPLANRTEFESFDNAKDIAWDVWSYRRNMTENELRLYSTWSKDLPDTCKEDMNAKRRDPPDGDSLPKTLGELRALSEDVQHWLTSVERPWEDGTDEQNDATSAGTSCVLL